MQTLRAAVIEGIVQGLIGKDSSTLHALSPDVAVYETRGLVLALKDRSRILQLLRNRPESSSCSNLYDITPSELPILGSLKCSHEGRGMVRPCRIHDTIAKVAQFM